MPIPPTRLLQALVNQVVQLTHQVDDVTTDQLMTTPYRVPERTKKIVTVSLPRPFRPRSLRFRYVILSFIFQTTKWVEDFRDGRHYYGGCFGHFGRGSNFACFKPGHVRHGDLSSRLLFFWRLSWTCCCHLHCVHRCCGLCPGTSSRLLRLSIKPVWLLNWQIS